MNLLLELAHHPLAHRAGWVLLHSLWQGALVGILVGSLRYALRRRSAQARYVVGCLGLLLLAAGPLLTFFSHSTWLLHAAARPIQPAGQAGAVAPGFSAEGISDSNSWMQTGLLAQSSVGFLESLAPFLAGAWFLGVAVFSLRLIRGCWTINSLSTAGNEPVEVVLIEKLENLRHRLRISRPVRLLNSALVEVPTVIGWLRPVILLPAASLSGLTPAQLETILAHELAHVRRFDYPVNACQCLVETFLFYHPVMWWISRWVREEREHCCDDLVVQVCGDRVGYARALAQLEEFRATLPAMALAATDGSLLNRIRRLLGATADTGPAAPRQAGGLTLLAMGLGLLLLGGYLQLQSPLYQAQARVRVERDPAIQPTSRDERGRGVSDSYFLETEMEVVRSFPVLRRVVEDLDLNRKWGERHAAGGSLQTTGAVALLRNRTVVRPVRHTSLMEIQVVGTQPDETAAIANAVAAAYREQRLQDRKNVRLNAINALEDRFSEQDQRIKEAQQNVDRLRAGLHVEDGATDSEMRRHLTGLRIESQMEFAREKALLDQLKGLSREQLIQTLSVVMQDPAFNSLQKQLILAAQKLDSVSTDYGPDHPEVRKASAVVGDLRTRTRNSVDGMMEALGAKVASLKSGIEQFDREIEKAAAGTIERAAQNRPYFEAKRNLDELLRFRELLAQKTASEKLELGAPRTAPVEIIDRAEAPLRPTVPHRPRALALLALGVLLVTGGLLTLRTRES